MSEKTQGPKAESQMFGRDKTLNYIVLHSSVRISKNTKLQCLERLKYRTPMFGKTNKIYNQSNVWNSQNSELQCWKSKILEFECLRKAKH